MDIEKHSPKWLLNEIKNAKSDAHALFKIIEFQEALHEQCNIANVVGQSGQFCTCKKPDINDMRWACDKCGKDFDDRYQGA